MDWTSFGKVFVTTALYTLFGIVVFFIAFWAMVKMSPFSIMKELEADHNTAVAILMASVIIGLALIISAALHG